MRIFEHTVPIGSVGRVALAASESLAEHRARWGQAPPGGALDAVTRADLRGCGGAGFPVARKWQAAIGTGLPGILVVNGAESEPASAKDAALLQLRPHLVLDGVTAAARATGCTEAVVWLHRGADHSRISIERALVERQASGVVDVPLRIAQGPARYLSGESSGIVRALSGGPALPQSRAVPAAVSGIGGRPTLVHNVETLARVATLTTGGAMTTALLTVTTPTGQAVVEADLDSTLAATSATAGVAASSTVLLGGYGGTWHRWDAVADRPLRSLQGLLSAGIVLALPREACGVTVTARMLRYLADSSARQCGPCLFGLGDLADVMDRVASGRGRRGDHDRLQTIAASVVGRGACHHPDGAVRMLSSALEVFGADVVNHRRRGRCGKRHDQNVPGEVAA